MIERFLSRVAIRLGAQSMAVTSIITMLSCPGLHFRAQQAQAVIHTVCASQTLHPITRILYLCVGSSFYQRPAGFFSL